MTKQCMSNDSSIFKYNDNSRRLINAQRPFCLTKLESILSKRLCHYPSLNLILKNINGNLNEELFPNFDSENENENESENVDINKNKNKNKK